MKYYWLIMIFAMVTLFSCSMQKEVTIKVTNPLDINRKNETIELKYSDIIKFFPEVPSEQIQIKNKCGDIIPSQKIDCEGDGNYNHLIFQTDLAAKENKTFSIVVAEPQEFESKTFARFVPEREDDFAWENDRIAYRMYSKKLAAKENVDSGVDVWVKSVDYLVIDKWYASEEYHADHGEGLDFYKVGPSRGCGGLAIFDGEKMIGNGGFADYKVIANGPIRSVFQLHYEPVEIDGKKYSETRTIAIDAGSNVNKVISKIDTDSDFQVAVGLKIHPEQGEGSVINNKKDGYVSFWEPATEGNGELGTAIIMKSGHVTEMKEIDDHHVTIADVKAGEKFVYYAGAGWNKSKDFASKKDWDNYVKNKALCINNPIKIELNK